MARNKEFHDYVMDEVLAGIEGIASRPMFGGYGIYKNGVFFALITEGALYFKADEKSRPRYERHGSHPFVYSKRGGKQIALSYWEVPADVMEDRDELRRWVADALRAKTADAD